MSALDIIQKAVLPTHLSTAEIREQLAADIYERAVLSARTTEKAYLERMKALLVKLTQGRINAATFRHECRIRLAELGYSPEGGFPGADALVPPAKADSLRDLASAARLNLIAKTEADKAASVARLQGQTRASLDADPAWRLRRFEKKGTERDWWSRWLIAGQACAWQGACKTDMVALKGSPIWEALGDRAAFPDALGNNYPPFAYNSGLDWDDVVYSRG